MARIVQIGKRRWLAGMRWSSFEDRPTRDEMQDEAERFEASWSCVRIGEDAIQAGFSPTIEGVKKPGKLYSLAAMLADSREQPWLGIFKIAPGLWWYVAVRDRHAILPDGDVIGGEEEIFAARERHSGFEDWKYIEGDLDLLAEFIAGIDAKPTPVRSMQGTSMPVMPVVASGVALAAALGGGAWWWHQKQLAEIQAQQAAMAVMRAQLAASQAKAAPPSPLLTTPEPNAWLAACGAVLDALPLSHNGWLLEGVSCNGGSAQAQWTRTAGATVAAMPSGVLEPAGNKVDESIPLPGLKPAGKNNAIDLPTAKLAMRAWAQAAGFALNMTEPPVPVALPGAPGAQPGQPVPVPQVNISMQIPVTPFHLNLSEIQGLRLTSLRMSETGWNLEGTIYGR